MGCLDWKVGGAKELAGEFNVRKFNLPQVRIFVSRARSPSKAGMKGDEGELLPAADVRLPPTPSHVASLRKMVLCRASGLCTTCCLPLRRRRWLTCRCACARWLRRC